MFAGLENGITGLQRSDLQMDVLGTRLSSDITVPFPQIIEAATPAGAPLFVPREGDDRIALGGPTAGQRTSFFQLPGLLPPETLSSLGGDLAGDMGLFLVAKAAYQVNARVVSTESRELKVLTHLGE